VKCLPCQFKAYVKVDELSGHGQGFDKGRVRQHIPWLPTWSSNLGLQEGEEGRNIQQGTVQGLGERPTFSAIGHQTDTTGRRPHHHTKPLDRRTCILPTIYSRQPRIFRWNLEPPCHRLVGLLYKSPLKTRQRHSETTRHDTSPEATGSSVMPSVKRHVPQI